MADRTTGGLPAVEESPIGGLPGIAGLYDDTLIPVEQQGEARHMTGRQWRLFAQASAEQYVEEAKEAAEEAKEAVSQVGEAVEDARRAAGEAEESAQAARQYSGKPPVIRDGTWWTWNAETQAYEDTGETAQGPKGDKGSKGSKGDKGDQGERGPQGEPGADGTSFTVLGLYATLAGLTQAHPTGAAGEAWAVGTAEANEVYLWDTDAEAWRSVGSLQGPRGEMGLKGEPGADATVNGVKTLTISAGANVQVAANGSTLTISARPDRLTLTLTAAGWTGGVQTVTAAGVLADETKQLLHVMPAAASQSAYFGAGVRCTGQNTNRLTFAAETMPTQALTVYVVMQEV